MAITDPARELIEPRASLTLMPPTPFVAPRRAGVARPALVAQLEAGVRRKVTTLLAPAGWGKSALLAEWMAETSLPVAWLPLGPRDDEIARLLRQLARALSPYLLEATTDLLARLRTPYPPDADDAIDLISLAIEDADIPMALVIDDLQFLRSADAVAVIRALLEATPPSLRLVLASRQEPPVQLGRLRVQGDVTELRADELRFDAGEARALFADLDHPAVDDAFIDVVMQRTEGWAAGLQIAALTLRTGAGDPRSVAEVAGTQREVAGFLCEEVFDRLDPAMATFLLEASPFEKVSAVFLDAVLDRTDSAAMLQQAADAHLFVTPLQCAQRKYRIHPLFRDYLQAELGRRRPGFAEAAHRRAAAWLQDRGEPLHAFVHLVQAGALEEGIALADRISTEMVLTSERIAMFVGWIESLPRGMVLERPRLLRIYAQALTMTGRIAEADALIAEVDGHPNWQPHQADAMCQVELLAIRSRIAAYKGDHAATIALANEALSRLGGRDRAWQASLHLDLGWAYRALGELEQANEAFQRASRLGWAAGALQPALWGTRYLALGWMTEGRIREAIALVEADAERAAALDVGGEPIMAALCITRGELAEAQGEFTEARLKIEGGIALAEQTSDAKILMNGHVALAMLDMREGSIDRAMLTFRRGTRIFDGEQEAALAALMALKSGQRTSARRWADGSGLSLDDDLLPERAPATQITFAWVHLLTGDEAATIAFLERVTRQTVARGWHGRAVRWQVTLALALAKAGRADEAMDWLLDALRFAAPEHMVRDFIDAGVALHPLLRDVMRSRETFDRAFARELLGDRGEGDQTSGMVEALTDRQMDVLRELASGRSNREIADALYLAEGTVKAHVHQITAKLLTRNRTEAVARARELGLLG